MEQDHVTRVDFDRDGLSQAQVQLLLRDFEVILPLLVRHNTQFVRPGHKLHATVLHSCGHEGRPDVHHPERRHAIGGLCRVSPVLMPQNQRSLPLRKLRPRRVIRIQPDLGPEEQLYNVQKLRMKEQIE